MQQYACWNHSEVMCFYCLLAVPLSLHISLHEQAQGPIVSRSCAVVLQFWSRLMFFVLQSISALVLMHKIAVPQVQQKWEQI
jgi:hypothetical protein